MAEGAKQKRGDSAHGDADIAAAKVSIARIRRHAFREDSAKYDASAKMTCREQKRTESVPAVRPGR